MDMQLDRNRARPERRALPFHQHIRLCELSFAVLFAGAVTFLLCLASPVPAQTAAQDPGAGEADAPKAIPAPRHPREMTYMKRKWGVEILFVRETAAGQMLEFRYKVLDPEKARALFVRKTKPVLTDVKSGIQLAVPAPAKTGALRNSDVPIADRTYWMFFSNTARLVKAGDRVNIQIGDFLVEGLIVQ